MRTRKLAAAAAAVALLGVLNACGDDGGDQDDPPAAQAAADECTPTVQKFMKGVGLDYKVDAVMKVGDDGHTVTVSNSPDDLGLESSTVTAMMCLLGALDAPDSVTSQVEQTSGLSGRQSTEWDDVSLSWSYVKGTGVSAVFTTN